MFKNILVTGANGQLGSELQVLFSAYPQFHFFFTDLVVLDICDKDELAVFIDKNGIDYLINCAAYTAVDKAEDEPEICYKINRDAVLNIAEATQGKARVIHVSTDYVFDGKGNRPYTESDPVNPQSVYGKSKLEGEEMLLKINPDSIVIRTSWLYSTFGNNFVKTMIRLGREKENLNVVADQLGTPTYAADLAKAILDVVVYCEQKHTFPTGIYHYSNEGIINWYEFTLKIHELAGITTCRVKSITTAEYPTKATRPTYSVLDKSKITDAFELRIPRWEESLKICINHLGSTK